MSITSTGNLGPMILQSLAPALLYVPTPTMPPKQFVVVKSPLIEMEIYIISTYLSLDNIAQAKAA